MAQQPFQLAAGGAQLQHEAGDQGRLPGDGCLTFSRLEAARVIGVSPRTVDRLIETGELRYCGSTHRISKATVEAFVHGQSVRRRIA